MKTEAHARTASCVAPVDASFEQRLIDGIRPMSEFFLAAALHQLFDTGLYDELEPREQGATARGLAETLEMDEWRLTGFLLYLANEGVVVREDERFRLTPRGRHFGELKPWYTMMIGGYATTLAQIGQTLPKGAPSAGRDGRYVGLGSCEISRFDGMPITRSLIAAGDVDCREILDLGCGNGLYLVEFCRALTGMTAWGVEPDRGGFEEACGLVEAEGMSERVRLTHSSATDFLGSPPADCNPDLIVFGYVLHEILAQDGEDAVVDLLQSVVDRFPQINVVVIEVANEIDNPRAMRHGLATNFWNPYFLVHYFTRQRLEKQAFWDELFERAGLSVAATVSTDPRADSTGLELGYLLRGPAC